MPPIVAQLLSQPWFVTGAGSIGAFLLGLIIPRRNGSSWLSGIIFFLPYLFLDLLDMVHTKKFKYYGLVTAMLAIEAFFAFRAATVYYDVLNTRMPLLEMAIVCVIVFVAVFLCGYMVATHGGRWNFWRACTMLFVIFHDWAGTIWMNYSQPLLSTTSTAASTTLDQSSNDVLKVVLTIGMCVLGLLPFIMGAWAEELRPQLEKELDEEVDTFTSKATRQIKRRAVNRVLRMANRTDIVRLVRALPSSEFNAFKQFVMPIIATPGTPYNLTPITEGQDSGQPLQLSATTGHQNTGQSATLLSANRPQGAPTIGQKRTDQSGQLAMPEPAIPSLTMLASGQDGMGQSDQQVTTHRSATTSQGMSDQDKLNRTVAFLQAYPQATDEELAAHLGLSRPASALFWKHKAEELLRQGQQFVMPQQPLTLGMIEQRMLEAITSATPEQQAEIRTLAATQPLAEFTRTLQQRYPSYANYITESRVANVMAYDRQQHAIVIPANPVPGQAAMGRIGRSGQPATDGTGKDNTPGHQEQPADRPETTGHDEPDKAASQDHEQPVNIIDMTGHRTPRSTGQVTPDAPKSEHSTGTGQSSEQPARSQPDTGARIAAYRMAHQHVTQKQVGEARRSSWTL